MPLTADTSALGRGKAKGVRFNDVPHVRAFELEGKSLKKYRCELALVVRSPPSQNSVKIEHVTKIWSRDAHRTVFKTTMCRLGNVISQRLAVRHCRLTDSRPCGGPKRVAPHKPTAANGRIAVGAIAGGSPDS